VTFKAAVIGAGYWGKNLVRNFYNLGVLKVICDTSEKTLGELKQQYNNVETTPDVDLVFKDPDINAVVIAAPAANHYALALRALRENKDVFVEKPLCLSVQEGKELCLLAGEKKRILMVGHILHYHPAGIVLKQAVASGLAGSIHHIYSYRLNLGKFRSEENVMWSFAPHDISLILSLAGDMPSKISAAGTAGLRPEIYDTVCLQLEFDNNLRASVLASWLYPIKEQKVVVVGSEGMLVFDDTAAREQKLLYFKEPVQWKNGIPEPVRNNPEMLEVAGDEPLRQECLAFIEAVNSRQAPETDGWEGLRVLEILSAGQKSLLDKGNWVKVGGPKEEVSYFAHPTAVIDEGCSIGAGVKIWHFSHVMAGAVIGPRCNIGQNVVVAPGVALGSNVKIQNNVSVYTGVTCEDDVFLGPSMVFTNVKIPRSHVSRRDQYIKTIIHRGASIGANATIVCGIEIGKYAMIGAGAVVTKDIQDHALVMGNPARQVGWVCVCGERLEPGEQCRSCGFKLDI